MASETGIERSKLAASTKALAAPATNTPKGPDNGDPGPIRVSVTITMDS